MFECIKLRAIRCALLILACLLLCNCAGNASPVWSTLSARDDINLGTDAGSKAASLLLHAMQITDLYTNRLNKLQYVPDTSQMRLAADTMRREDKLYTVFITDFASAMYSSRPSIGKAQSVSIEESGSDMEFDITDNKGVRYEGRLDYDAAACYVFRYEGEDWQYYRLIGDDSGYYMELILMQNTQWYIHRAYYSPRRWFNASAVCESEPEADMVYHFLPDDFGHHLKGMPPLQNRMEYTLDKQLYFWDYNHGHDLFWDLAAPAATAASPLQLDAR